MQNDITGQLEILCELYEDKSLAAMDSQEAKKKLLKSSYC